MKLRTLCSLLTLAFTPAGANAQDSPTQIVEKVDVRVINVDVTVTDGSGHPVRGLTKEDFEVLEDGQPQRITNFYAIDRLAQAADGAQGELLDPRRLRRRTMVVIDNNYLAARDREIALQRLMPFIEKSEPEAEWSIAAAGQGLTVLLPFTADRTGIAAALSEAKKMAVSSLRAADNDRDILSDPFRRNESAEGYDFGGTVQFQARERTTRNARAIGFLGQAMAEAAQSLAAIDGKKQLILITGDIERNTGYAAFDRGSDREMRDLKKAIDKLFNAVVQEANAANVSVFVVNASSSDAAAPQHDASAQSFGGHNDLAVTAAADTSDPDSAGIRIALGTGGLYLKSHRVTNSYEKIDERATSFYSIGYSPNRPEDRKYHRVTVRSKKGLKVTHREGYLDITPDEQLEQLLRLRISVLQPAHALPVRLDAKPNPEASTVALTASMPFNRVTALRSQDRYVGRVHVYLSIFDKNGKNVGFHHVVQNVSMTEAERAKAMNDMFRYQMNVRLAKGDFTVAMTLRDDLSREIGTATQKMKL